MYGEKLATGHCSVIVLDHLNVVKILQLDLSYLFAYNWLSLATYNDSEVDVRNALIHGIGCDQFFELH